MHLYIIRHAQSTNNALTDQRQRVKDPPLTELGHLQAKAVAQHLTSGVNLEQRVGVSEEDTTIRARRGYKITHLYCSAMYRALQTAQPISEALELVPAVWPDIHEHGGIFLDHEDERGTVGYPGMTRAEILAEFPNYYLPAEIGEAGWWHDGREDWPDCYARAIRVAIELRKRADNDDYIAIVTHGGFIDSLLKALTNQLPTRGVYYHHFNTALTHVEFYTSGHISIRYINRVPHLPADLVS